MSFEFVAVFQKKQMTNQNEDNFEEIKSFFALDHTRASYATTGKVNYEDSLQC